MIEQGLISSCKNNIDGVNCRYDASIEDCGINCPFYEYCK